METVLCVNHFSFQYADSDKKAIDDVSFDVRRGEFFCIIGSNGSGKSTLCSALAGLIPHFINGKKSGDVKVFDKTTDAQTMGELSTKIGLVFQNPFNQLSYTTSLVSEELAYGLCNLGVAPEEMIERVNLIAKKMRIDHILNKHPLTLSGGQVQRVALGSSLIMNPEIIVLDECTSQLDPLGSEEIFDIIKELNANGLTVILVDHDMERVARTADRIMVLDGGKVKLIDTPENVFGHASLSAFNVGVPDFTAIGRALDPENPRVITKEEDAIALVKRMAADEN